MIQIEEIHIREFRGIRSLDLAPERKSFVISGPNGSGKSGVVDAIQFALTGEISRLTGRGTVGLTVQRHGPHVDRRDDPAAALVSLRIFIPALGESFLLTRSVKTSQTFTLEPDSPAARKVVEEVGKHPELTLSRREIIKFILVEAGQRSKEIQALLQLDDVTARRRLLLSARNRLATVHTAAGAEVTSTKDALRRHLDIVRFTKEDVLVAVNQRRRLLTLAEISEFTADTVLSAGVLEGSGGKAFNKESALRDVGALQSAEAGFAALGEAELTGLTSDFAALDKDPALLKAVKQRALVERGLALVDGPDCPLCDTSWEDAELLRAHLRSKLELSKAAEKTQQRILANSALLAGHARRLSALVKATEEVAKESGSTDVVAALSPWSTNLNGFAASLTTFDDVIAVRPKLAPGWMGAPEQLSQHLTELTTALKARPDQSATLAAQTFLTLAQDRLGAWQAARRNEAKALAALDRAKAVYQAYCDAMEDELGGLYSAVEANFAAYYRDINRDDEGSFKAKLEASEGRLDLKVDFYDKGMFPPGAYHSEGHQDGMGVCLYLALMKQLLGTHFQFAVLDDVVMSVDQGHRKQFCTLLRTSFGSTQFIITTHDKVWTKQMQTEGLIDRKSGVIFHSWSVETGPVFAEQTDSWQQIEEDIAKNDIPAAAGRLRRYLEYACAELADLLGAKLPYRGDFSYDVGDLLPAVAGRQGELLGLAAKSAQSWNNAEEKATVAAAKARRAVAMTKYGDENWIMNKAIHHNEWADFSRAEFTAVVEAAKELLSQFRCSNPECDSWFYVMPRRGTPEALRCRCAALNLNLQAE